MLLARERLVNIGIRPSANSQKMKRIVIAFSSFWEVALFLAFFLVVHKPCNAETDTCLQPYKNAVAIVKGVSHLVGSLGEAQCRKSWNQFKGYDSLSPRYVKRVPWTRKDHRWEK